MPLAAAAAGALFLATAMAHVVVIPPPAAPAPQMAMRPRGDDHAGLVQAEIRACMAHGDRSHEDCLDEAEGKALIQRAEQMAQLEDHGGARRAVIADDDVADAPPARSDAR